MQTILVACAVAMICGHNATAETLTEPRSLVESLRALDEGLPQVAAHKLRAFLQTNPPPVARRDATFALVRAFVAVPDGAAALATLDAAAPLPPTAVDAADASLAFWRAQALAAAGRWPEARDFYAQAAANATAADPALVARARFGQGESLLGLAGRDNSEPGQHSEAAALFRTIYNDSNVGELARLRGAELALDSHHLKEAVRALGDLSPAASGRVQTKEHAYLVGRLRLAQRQPALARQIFTAALAQPAA